MVHICIFHLRGGGLYKENSFPIHSGAGSDRTVPTSPLAGVHEDPSWLVLGWAYRTARSTQSHLLPHTPHRVPES
jgi:hypothetical protein